MKIERRERRMLGRVAIACYDPVVYQV